MLPLLLDRVDEQAAVDAAITRAALGDGSLVVVEGAAGMGKSALLAAVREAATAAGMGVWAAQGAELERPLGWGVVRQLFGPSADPAGLRGRAALARPVLDVTSPAPPATADSGTALAAALEGLYWLSVNYSALRPLALVVDDAQWMDAASARFIAYLTRRMTGLALLVVLATRPRPEGTTASLLGDPTARVLTLHPLTPSSCARLVRDSAPDAPEEVCAACHRATGGNPFYVGILAEAAGLAGAEPSSALVDSIGRWSPERLTRDTAARLAALPVASRDLAMALAILGDGVPLRLAGALARVAPDRRSRAADELRAGGLLTQGAALRFVHPIVAAGVRAQLAAGERSCLHARAARLLDDERAPVGRIATHLLATEPNGDAWAGTRLERAACDALERGAPQEAAVLLKRALEEPPLASSRAGLLLTLGIAEGLSLDVADAARHLAEAYALARDDAERMRAAMAAAGVSTQCAEVAEGTRLLSDLLALVDGEDPLAPELEAELTNQARNKAATHRRTAPVRRRLARRLARGERLGASALASIAADLVMAGAPHERARTLALAALEGPPRTNASGLDPTRFIAARVLIAVDELERVGALLDETIDEARGSGNAYAFAMASCLAADVVYRRGDVFAAESHARAALGPAVEHRWTLGLPAVVAELVTALGERGRFAEAQGVLAEAGLDGSAAAMPEVYPTAMLLFARGVLRTRAGASEAGLADLMIAGQRLDDHGETNPALVGWRAEAALAAHALGEAGPARALADAGLAAARRFGVARPLGLALRAHALVAGAEPDVEGLRAAARVLADSPARLEHGRALADLGVAHLAAGDTSRAIEALRPALELVHVSGAAVLEERVLAALRAAGARPRRALLSGPGALTPSERRVSDLAAQAWSNREIAEALFVTVRTVEFHLSGAYRKLGIASRRDLVGALA